MTGSLNRMMTYHPDGAVSPRAVITKSETSASHVAGALLHNTTASQPQKRWGVLRLAMLVAAFACLSASAQTPLTNAGTHPGEISPAGDSDAWTFTAAAGSGVMLRVGSTNFTPRIQVFDSGNAMVAETTSGNTLVRDGYITLTATNGGTYTVIVSATFANQSGTYGLRFAAASEPFEVPAGDQGGELQNGAFHSGVLELGDLDVWRFDAEAGDGLMLRMGSETLTPWLRLYGPGGAFIQETTSGNTLTRDGFLTLTATNSGTYTLVVSATHQGQSGNYSVHRAQARADVVVSPGDEGGFLANGAATPGTLSVGDLDVWRFTADAGEGLMLRMGADSLTPWLRLYGPGGGLVADTTSGNTLVRDGFLVLTTTNAGDYTLVVSATHQGQNGSYTLHRAQAPAEFTTGEGDEGGELINGAVHAGRIDVGDLDVWRFSADAGSGLMLRMGADSLTPWLRLYGPNGDLVAGTTSGNTLVRDGFLVLTTTNAGDYTLVVSATHQGQNGNYTLHRAQAPGEFVVSEGDQGGALINGLTNSASLTIGDLDLWSFIGTPGDSNVLAVTATGFTPLIRVYGPDGALVGEAVAGNTLARSTAFRHSITNAGVYTAVIAARYAGQASDYTLKQSRVPPDLIVSGQQTVDESMPIALELSAQDPDVPLKPLMFDLLSGPPGLTLTLAGATNATLSWTTSEADGPSTNQVIATVTDVVNGQAFTRTNTFDLVINEINSPPSLTVPANGTIDELTQFNESVVASDSDLPANTLSLQLLVAPEGMTLDPVTGMISWAPSELQGPSTNTITVVVRDSNPWAINEQELSTTNSFVLIVRELNRPPVLVVPDDQVIDESTALNVSASATDPDLPANPLVFSLGAAPSGMTIDPMTGAITWTPTEAQGPTTETVVVVVTDSNPAADVPALSVTNTFTVVVRERNADPVLEPIADQSIHFGVPITIETTATDSDLPANVLTYSLQGAPEGMTVDETGTIRWTPEQSQVGTYTITLTVTDDADPPGSASQTFTLTVAGEGARLQIHLLTGDLVQIQTTGDLGVEYELQVSTDLKEWQRLISFQLTENPHTHIEQLQPASAARFYRLQLAQ